MREKNTENNMRERQRKREKDNVRETGSKGRTERKESKRTQI